MEGTIEDLLLGMDIDRKHNNFYLPIAIPRNGTKWHGSTKLYTGYKLRIYAMFCMSSK
jgi:hypothetical protein